MALDKQLRDDGWVVVRFTIPAVVAARQATVVGEFNDWSEGATPMDDVPGGGFTAEVAVAAGRTYRFRYLLDGQRWENDWAADGYVSNEHGGDDSLLDLSRAVVDAIDPGEREPQGQEAAGATGDGNGPGSFPAARPGSLRDQRPRTDADGTDIREYTGEPVETEDGWVLPQQMAVGKDNEVGGGEWPDGDLAEEPTAGEDRPAGRARR